VDQQVPAGSGIVVADLDRRFYAGVVDRMIAWGPDLVVAVLAQRYLLARGHLILGVLVIATTVLAVGAALATLLGTTGRTPGRALLGLRVVRVADGRPLGIGPAMRRTLVVELATVPFGFGLAALAWTTAADPGRQRRGWHDHLVSSVVVDARPVPVEAKQPHDPGARHVVNLTAARLVPVRRTPVAPDGPLGRPASRPTAPSLVRPDSWALALDNGERVVVDTLLLIGRRPEAGAGEQGARLVTLPPAGPSASANLAPVAVAVVVASDGALVVTDRGAIHGSVLVRRGVRRPLSPDRPATLLEDDLLIVGDRTLTVVYQG
jgi:uncharacterized RDD family membrane protein YckC